MKLIITVIVLSVVIFVLLSLVVIITRSNVKLKKEKKMYVNLYNTIKESHLKNEELKSKIHTGDDGDDFDNSISILQDLSKRD